MSIAILTKEGIPTLFNFWKNFRKVHTYIYSASHPMIAITIFDASARGLTD